MATPHNKRAPSRWNGLSPEQRQQERRRLLVDAAFELLSTEGSAGTTVRAVCGKARLNPRYFYESFEDLDQLVVATYDSVLRQLRHRIAESVAHAADEDDAMRRLVSSTVEFIAEDRRRGRVLYTEALDNAALNLRRIRNGVALMEVVQSDEAGWRDAATGTDLGRVGAAVVVGGFTEIMVAWLDGRIGLEPDELVEHATRMFVAIREVMRAAGTARA